MGDIGAGGTGWLLCHLCIGVRRESSSFPCLEYSDATDLRSSRARTWEGDYVRFEAC